MLQEARDLQTYAVASLVEMATLSRKTEITFKAPTGSGKTFMMADFINRILEKEKDVAFIVSSLSKGDLARQNYEKFLEYLNKGNFKRLKPHLISSQISGEERLFIPTDNNVYFLPVSLYRAGSRLSQGATLVNFLFELNLKKSIYLIKDECHIATNKIDGLSSANFIKTFNFSATPKLERGQNPDIEISNIDAVNAKLIKQIEWGGDDETVEDAINKFEQVKEQYRNHLFVNPCLIIQISNKDKAEKELQEIYTELKKHSSLKWMLIVDDPKKCDTNDFFKVKKLPLSRWKDYAKENISTIDIIIFKMVITEGWDIPRACMLYQVRDTKSKQLDEQVMGRVRRNPRLLDFETLSQEAQNLALTAWVWGKEPEDYQKPHKVNLWENSFISGEVKIKTTKLKPLMQKAGFDLPVLLSAQPEVTAPTSIFKLYEKLKKADNTAQKLCENYSTSFSKWREFAENIDAVCAENKKFVCNYSISMETAKDENGKEVEVSFALSSFYTDAEHYLRIGDWVWKREDGEEKFAFDSEAEKDWAEILKDLSKEENDGAQKAIKKIKVGKKTFIEEPKQIYLWGKNYASASAIKFEYYLEGAHFSFPDFVMKDAYNRVHIFEVKSVNFSSAINGGFNSKIYKEKVEELKRAYKQASKLTSQIFYLPILQNNIWRIFQYDNGDARTLTKEQFEKFIKTMPE